MAEEDGTYFTVEKILDDGYDSDDGIHKWLVKWKGYDETENSWYGPPFFVSYSTH